MGIDGKDLKLYLETMNKIKKTRLEFLVKNKNRNWENVLMTDEASFYFCSPEKYRWVSSDDTYERTKSKFSKKFHVCIAFSSKGIIKLQFFTGNMDSQKYLEILENSIDEINTLHPNGFILL